MRRAWALASWAAAGSAAAQSPPMWVNYTDAMRSAYSGWRALQVIRQSSRCIVERHRGASESLVMSVPDTDAEARIMWGPIRSRLDQCSHMGVAVSGVILRGSIAEALYESAFSAPAAGEEAVAVAPIQWPAGHATAPQLAPVYGLGRCVVAADPRLVHRLLATEPFSDAETAILNALQPLLAPCLDAGSTFETNRETLRAVLAESLYKWADAQRRGRSGG